MKLISQESVKNFGCIIVKNDEIIATGYNGAPRGRCNCTNVGKCIRTELNIPRGERYELCVAVSASPIPPCAL